MNKARIYKNGRIRYATYNSKNCTCMYCHSGIYSIHVLDMVHNEICPICKGNGYINKDHSLYNFLILCQEKQKALIQKQKEKDRREQIWLHSLSHTDYIILLLSFEAFCIGSTDRHNQINAELMETQNITVSNRQKQLRDELHNIRQ